MNPVSVSSEGRMAMVEKRDGGAFLTVLQGRTARTIRLTPAEARIIADALRVASRP
jgi:hypothetical protein